MIKTAIFVEGQTELVFIREYLLKTHDYQNISIECYTLFNDQDFRPTEYAFPNYNAEYFFQLINVGNDNAVLSRLLNREQYLWNVGFHRIIGLRDMYSQSYRELSPNRLINSTVIDEFKEATERELKKAINPENIDFCFAIMEGESWILGFHNHFVKINPTLTVEYINEHLKFDLTNIYPEVTFFHPARTLADIYNLVGEKYNKSKGNIESIMAALEKADFKSLINSDKCNSFRIFASLFPFD